MRGAFVAVAVSAAIKKTVVQKQATIAIGNAENFDIKRNKGNFLLWA